MGFDPVTLSAAAAGAQFVQGGLEIAQGLELAHDRNEAYRTFRKRSLAALAFRGATVRSRTAQERAQIAEELGDLVAEGIRVRGQIGAAAGEGEVAGRTVAEANLDVIRSVGRTRSRLLVLQEFREAAAEQELRGLVTDTLGRLEAGVPDPTPIKSPLSLALEIGEAGLAGYEIGDQLFGEG